MKKRSLKRLVKEIETLDLDEGIKDLVVGLNYQGVRTTNSCEGHERSGIGYPFVDVLAEDGNKLLLLVRRFNLLVYGGDTKNDIVWLVLPRGEIRLMPDRSGRDIASKKKKISLKKMKESALEFGKMLQKLR